MRTARGSGRRSSERGAALVVALLVMLVLSAMGLVAMKSASDSNWIAGSYRVGAQAKTFSDSVVQFGLTRSGLRANSLNAMLQGRTETILRDSAATDTTQRGALRRGGYQVFVSDQDPGEGKATIYEDLGGSTSLLESDTLKGVESSNLGVDFQYIVRDPLPGPTAPGFGDQFCFTRVTVASEAVLGQGDTEEEQRSRRRLRSMARHASQAFIGPIECGAR